MEKLTMQGEFRKLNSLYGLTPDKLDTAEEIAARCAALTDQMDELLETRGHELKYLRNNKVKGELENLANVPLIVRRKASGQYIDAWANLLDKNYEWLERKYKEDAIKRRTAKEWRELERAYIVRSKYTLWDFYDDYRTLIEESTLLFILRLQIFGSCAWRTLDKVVTWDDYKVERKKWRQCKHRFCLELFPIQAGHFKEDDRWQYKRRSDARYCCDTCRSDDFKSKQQYLKTAKLYDNPTYLPQEVINEELELDASIQERAEKHEISYELADQLDALQTGEMKYTDFEAEAEAELNKRPYNEERRARYEAFIRGEGEPVFTVKIKNEENSERQANKRFTCRLISEEMSA